MRSTKFYRQTLTTPARDAIRCPSARLSKIVDRGHQQLESRIPTTFIALAQHRLLATLQMSPTPTLRATKIKVTSGFRLAAGTCTSASRPAMQALTVEHL
jgi:hypothetical protein